MYLFQLKLEHYTVAQLLLLFNQQYVIRLDASYDGTIFPLTFLFFPVQAHPLLSLCLSREYHCSGSEVFQAYCC